MPYYDDYEDAWGNAPETDELQEGTYFCVVDDLQLTETGPKSKNPGTPMLKWVLVVLGPHSIGRKIFHNRVFSNDPDRMKWIKIELSKAGVRGVKTISDLEGRLEEAIDVGMKVKIVINGEYTNVNFQGSFDADTYEPPEDGSLAYP